jgi:hypothetical protein
VAERVWYVKGRRAQRKTGKLQENKREKRRKKGDAEKAQHRALQTGPSRVALSLDFFSLRLIFFLSIFFNFPSHALRFFSYFFLKRALRAFGQS